MKIALHVLGMFLLGAVALICVGLLYHPRQRQRIPVSSALSAAAPTGTSGSSLRVTETPAAAAVAGLRIDLEVFVNAMTDRRRADAMRALNGGYHVADVLHTASPRDPAATAIFEALSDVRREIQNGHESKAVARAREASTHLADSSRLAAHRPSRLEPFVGATVISSTGDNLGTIKEVSSDAVQVESGGLRHLLGFIDLQSGTIHDVPTGDMLFGEARRTGMTMVLDTSR